MVLFTFMIQFTVCVSSCRRECISTHSRRTRGKNKLLIQQREFQANRPLGQLAQLQLSSVIYPSKHLCLVCKTKFNWKSHLKLINASQNLHQHHNYYVYKFDMSKHLSTNITLFRVYFSHSTPDCSFGYLRVWNNKTAYETKYCGVFSYLQLYIPENNVHMAIETRPFVVVNIKQMIYAAVDADKITTRKPTMHDSHLKWVLMFGHNRTTLNIYHLKVNPLYHIFIKTSNNNQTQLQLFDGPGINSPRIVPSPSDRNTAQFTSSSFQVVIHASGLFSMNYVRSKLQHSITLQEKTSIYLPQHTKCTRTICIAHVSAGKGFTVNASIHWLRQNGNYFTSNCGYSGVVLLSKKEDIITTKCVRYEVEILFEAKCLADKTGMYFVHATKLQEISYEFPKYHNFQNVYSAHKIYVVLFSSEGYSFAEAHLHISKVGCVVISLQLCESKRDFSTQILTTREELNHSCTIVQMYPWQAFHRDICVRSVQLEHPTKWTPHNRKEVAFTLDGFIAGELIFQLNLYWRNLQLQHMYFEVKKVMLQPPFSLF